MPYLCYNHPITEKITNKNAWKQIIKIITEHWTENNIFCPVCGNFLEKHKTDKPINDLFCPKCKNDFELKSKHWEIGKKLPAWNYEKAILQMETKPMHLFILKYSDDFTITDFLLVPKYFFTKDILVKRPKALKNRPNYFMSDIDFSSIPESWKIYYLKNRTYKTKTEILKDFQKIRFLENEKQSSKWWIFDIMKCIEKLNKKEFSLQEIYTFENHLKEKYPQNNFIKDKIRQQLQFLRNKKFLEFLWNWKYRVL